MSDSRPLRVLMLAQYPFNEREQTLGGVIQATYQLVNGLTDIPGTPELHVLSLNEDCRAPTIRKIDGVTFYHLPKGKSSAQIVFFEPFRVAYWFMRLYLRLKPQVVHAQGNVSFLLLSLIHPRRGVQTPHGVFRNEQKVIPRDQFSLADHVRFFLRETLESFYFRRMRHVIATTGQIARMAEETGAGGKHIYKINNSVDKSFFSGVAPDPQQAPITILFVGLITPRKGLHVLIEAFKRLVQTDPAVDVRLRIVGIWTAAPEYVEEQKKACGDLLQQGRVVFTGGVDHAQLLDEFKNCSLFVLPSLGESAPIVISQAMSVGLPTISTMVGGIPEMIENEVTGMLVPPGNADALYDALKALVDDSGLRSRLAAAARQIAAQRYHPRVNAEATLDVYRAVAARYQP